MSESLEQILDECIDRMKRGESVRAILDSHPTQADRLRPLLGIVHDLAALPEPAASPEEIMRSFVRASAMKELPAKPMVRFFSRSFLLRAAAVLVVVFLGGWGTVTASADAAPGDLLYPVKRFTERAKFFLTINREDKAELRIVFSSERLKEAAKGYQQSGVLNQQLLDEMLEEARLAAQTSEDLSGPSRSLLAARAASTSEYQRQVLEGLKSQTPSQQDQTLSRYANMCGRRAQWMQGMCGWRQAAPQPVPSQPRQDDQQTGRWRDQCPW